MMLYCPNMSYCLCILTSTVMNTTHITLLLTLALLYSIYPQVTMAAANATMRAYLLGEMRVAERAQQDALIGEGFDKA